MTNQFLNGDLVTDRTNGQTPVKKRKIEVSVDQRELAKLYESLSDSADSTRLKAALEIVIKCKNNNGVGNEPTFEKARPVCIRLIRGLCSSHKYARQGFFVALVEVFRLFKNSSELLQECLSIIENQTQPEQGASGQERRNNSVAKLFAYSAVIRSKMLFYGFEAQKSRFFVMLNSIVDMYLQHPSLEQHIATQLSGIIATLHNDQAPSEWQAAVLETFVQRNVIKSALGIGMWLETMQKAPSVRVPNNIWHHENPLSSKALPHTIMLMKQSTGSVASSEENEMPTVRSGARQQKPGPAWMIIIAYLKVKSRERSQEMEKFKKFWQEAIDKNFFASSASHEKKYLGFWLLKRTLPNSTEAIISIILSSNLVQTLINQSAKSKRYLFAQAREILGILADEGSRHVQIGVAIINALLNTQRGIDFDKLTGTETIRSMIQAHILSKNHQQLTTLLQLQFDSNDDESLRQKKQYIIVNVLSSIIRKTNQAFLSDIHKAAGLYASVEFLACKAYPNQSDNSSMSVSIETRRTIRASLESAIAARVSHRDIYVSRILQQIAKNCMPEANTVDSSNRPALHFLRQELKEIHTYPKEHPHLLAISLLSLVTLMMSEGGGGIQEVWSTLSELQQIKSDFNTPTVVKRELFDTMVDIVLATIAQPPVLYKRIADWAFQLICQEMGGKGIEAMRNVLQKKENLSGKNEIEEDSEDEGSELDDLEDSVDAGKDEKMEDVEAENGSESSNESDSADSELTHFNDALASTLGTSNQAVSDPEQSDSSMDDEQMFQLEPQLTEMFKQRLAQKPSDSKSKRRAGGVKKQEQATARQAVLEFKNRVLDLFEEYLTKHPGLPLTLRASIPLLELVRTTKSKQLRNKAIRILKDHHTAARKKGEPSVDFNGSESLEVPKIWNLLTEVHDEALLPGPSQHDNLCSSVSLFLCRCIVKMPSDNAEQQRKRMTHIQKIYMTTKQQWKEKHEQGLSRAFWDDWETWKRDVGKQYGNVSMP